MDIDGLGGYSGKMSQSNHSERPRSDQVSSASRSLDGRVYLALPRDTAKTASQDEDGRVAGLPRRAEAQFDDPMAPLQGRLRRGQRRGEAERQNAKSRTPPAKKIRQARWVARKNAGSCCASQFYNALGIEIAMRNKTRAPGLLRQQRRHEAADRRAHHQPRRRKSAWENKEHYFFRTAFSLEDTYRALDVLCGCKRQDRVRHQLRAIDKMGIRDTACVFYDVMTLLRGLTA